MGDELRGHPERFAEHYNQAALFLNSQTDWEQRHIVNAFAFELSKVTVAAIRQRMVASLRNVSDDLAQAVADKLGMALPDALPRALREVPQPEVEQSPTLSLTARPGEMGVATRKVAILVAEGVDGAAVSTVAQALIKAGVVVRLVGQRIGPVATADGGSLDADASLDNHPSGLFDGAVVPAGAAAAQRWREDGRALEFIRDGYRHGKTLLAVGEGADVLQAAGIDLSLDDDGLITGDAPAKTAAAFIDSLARHRHPQRETDPARI